MSFWEVFIDAQLLISILFILYSLFLLAVIFFSKSPLLHSAFFRLFVITGILDVVAVIALEWTRADVRLCLGPDYEVVTRLASVVTGIARLTHMFGCFLMTLNRYAAVCFPDVYEKWWTARMVYTMLIISIASSCAIYIQLLFNKLLYAQINGRWRIIGSEMPIKFIRIACFVLTVVYEAVSVALIARTVYVLRKASGSYGMVMVTAIDCVVNIFACIYYIGDLLRICKINVASIQWVYENYSPFVFLNFTTNALSIVILSDAVRQEILRKYMRRTADWTATNSHADLYYGTGYRRISEGRCRTRVRRRYNMFSVEIKYDLCSGHSCLVSKLKISPINADCCILIVSIQRSSTFHYHCHCNTIIVIAAL